MPSTSKKILIIEETSELVEVLRRLLRSLNYRVKVSLSISELQELLASSGLDAIFCDIGFWRSEKEVFDIISEAGKKCIPVILLADYSEFDAVEAGLKAGACSWLSKPLKAEHALKALNNALNSKLAKNTTSTPEEKEVKLAPPPSDEVTKHFGFLIGEHKTMLEVYRQVRKVAETDISVLVYGESGTGKELIAQSVHKLSKRSQKSFVAINCSSMPENLLESELFGHVKGAFTGAVKNKDGLFLAANGGTLFLDEVGSIPLNMQLVLLRALQEHEIRPVGGLENIPVNVRIIAASNEDLNEKMERGLLRNDLFYRLCGFSVRLPLLRDRRTDIPLLIKYFLAKAAKKSVSEYRISYDAMELLSHYNWPGNVRELENVILRAEALADNGLILPKDLPIEVTAQKNNTAVEQVRTEGEMVPLFPENASVTGYSLKAYLKICERHYVKQVLKSFHGDKEATAKSLGVSMATFYRKFEE
ncbi:MAG: sigma-54 dependent transcriptional regulator [Lentisphaeria bacterium]